MAGQQYGDGGVGARPCGAGGVGGGRGMAAPERADAGDTRGATGWSWRSTRTTEQLCAAKRRGQAEDAGAQPHVGRGCWSAAAWSYGAGRERGTERLKTRTRAAGRAVAMRVASVQIRIR